MFNLDEPFYPRLARGRGSHEVLTGEFTPPESWLQEVRGHFVAAVPKQIRRHLDDAGWKAFVTLWPTDIRTNTRIWEPSQDDLRCFPQHLRGQCIDASKTIYSSMGWLDASAPPPSASKRFSDAPCIARVLTHEAAHAVASEFLYRTDFYRYKFQELARQDIIAFGGYKAMRREGWKYFTPNKSNTDRDFLEIWAEALAAVWGGGARQADLMRSKFPKSYSGCEEFSDFLTKTEFSELTCRYNSQMSQLSEAAVRWYYKSAGSRLDFIELANDQEDSDLHPFFGGKSPSKLCEQSLRLIDGMEKAMETECGWGVRYHKKTFSPKNVALMLTQDLLRKSPSIDTYAGLNAAWDHYVRNLPPSRGTKSVILPFCMQIFDIQTQMLPVSQREKFDFFLSPGKSKNASEETVPEWTRTDIGKDVMLDYVIRRTKAHNAECPRPRSAGILGRLKL